MTCPPAQPAVTPDQPFHGAGPSCQVPTGTASACRQPCDGVRVTDSGGCDANEHLARPRFTELDPLYLEGASFASTTSARIFIVHVALAHRYSNIAHATISAFGGVASSKPYMSPYFGRSVFVASVEMTEKNLDRNSV